MIVAYLTGFSIGVGVGALVAITLHVVQAVRECGSGD